MVALLERAAPLEALRAALAASSRAGQLALVAGEAGVGKSSLVRELAERHAGGARVLVGACDPLMTPRALGPVHDIAPELGGRLAAAVDEGRPREEVFAALLDELADPSRPSLVVVEDAHWADDATLDLLVFLARRVQRVRALLVVTYRDDELGPDHPLRGALGFLSRAATVRLTLAPLSEAAVDELARASGRSPRGVHARTGGNPFLVTEVLAAGGATVPATVGDLVLARFRQLPADARESVQLVAVVPTRVELWLLESLLGTGVHALDTAAAAGLLVVEADGVRFRHELVRQAVEHALSPVVRRDLNRRVLAALTTAPARDVVDVARVVHHARAAGDDDAVLRYAPRAGRQAAAVAAHREAVEHYRAALAVADRSGADARAELLENLSLECYLAGLSSEAVAARRAAVELRRVANRPEQVGAGLRWLSRMHWWDGDRPGAEAAATAAIEVLEPLGPGHDLAMAYSNRAQLEMLAHRPDAAVAWARRAIALAEAREDAAVLTHALTNLGSAHLQHGDPRGPAELERAFDVAVAAGLEDDAARALGNLATISAEMKDYDHAVPALDRGVAWVQAHELPGYAQHLLGHRARVRLDHGDWRGAEADARAALDETVGRSPRLVDGLVPLGLLFARRGDPAAAAVLDDAAAHADATKELQWSAPVAAARAEHAWLSGDDRRAGEEAARVYASALEVGHPWFTGELALWLRVGGALTEVPTVAAEPWRLLLDGDWRASADHWAQRGLPYHHALALALSGDDAAGIEALAVLDRLGARATALRVRRDLRRRGRVHLPRGPIRTTTTNPVGLTARQVEVLQLLVEGLTDAEIAARLSLSTKTVGHHVSAVLAKLQVASRRQAGPAARRLGLVGAEDGERTARTREPSPIRPDTARS